MTHAPSASDVVATLVELSQKHGGKSFLRDVQSALAQELAGDGMIAVTLTTPTGNAGDLAKRIHEILEQKYNRPVQITEKAEPSLIGGAILQFGDERIDLSVRGALDQFAAGLRSQTVSL